MKSIKFLPQQDDGVELVGKLNFWESQARISVQVFDVRPSISTVLKKFEIVNDEGDTIEVRGDHVLKNEYGRLTTLYHHMNNLSEAPTNATQAVAKEEINNV